MVSGTGDYHEGALGSINLRMGEELEPIVRKDRVHGRTPGAEDRYPSEIFW